MLYPILNFIEGIIDDYILLRRRRQSELVDPLS